MFSCPTDDGKFYYSHTGDITYYDWVGRADKTARINKTRKTLHIDAGYYCEDGENCDTLAIPEPEYVDLGLSVKWATFNVGATSPEDYGDYFAWGETEPKDEYTWATYKWGNGTSAAVLTKYNTQDGKTILEPEDDAAHVHWGNNWRVPTDEEYAELRDLCTWTWTIINNVKGYEVKGPNGNSIFLPTTGYMIDTTLKLPTYGYYWSNSLYDTNLSKSNCNYFSSHPASWGTYLRIMGFAIRPVYDDR